MKVHCLRACVCVCVCQLMCWCVCEYLCDSREMNECWLLPLSLPTSLRVMNEMRSEFGHYPLSPTFTAPRPRPPQRISQLAVQQVFLRDGQRKTLLALKCKIYWLNLLPDGRHSKPIEWPHLARGALEVRVEKHEWRCKYWRLRYFYKLAKSIGYSIGK